MKGKRNNANNVAARRKKFIKQMTAIGISAATAGAIFDNLFIPKVFANPNPEQPIYPLTFTEMKRALREELKAISLFVDNGLDQALTVQVKANRENALAKSVNVGSSFTVSANSTDSRTLSPDTSGFLPYLTVSLVCSVAPTLGSVTIYRIRSKDDEVKVVDTLEIRDTSTHDNSTDPTKIFVVEW